MNFATICNECDTVSTGDMFAIPEDGEVLVDCLPCGTYGTAYCTDEGPPFVVLGTDVSGIALPEHIYKGIACSHTEERLLAQGKIPVD